MGPPFWGRLCEKVGSGWNPWLTGKASVCRSVILAKPATELIFRSFPSLLSPGPCLLESSPDREKQGGILADSPCSVALPFQKRNVPAFPGLTTSPVQKVSSKCRNLRPSLRAPCILSPPGTVSSERTGSLPAALLYLQPPHGTWHIAGPQSLAE